MRWLISAILFAGILTVRNSGDANTGLEVDGPLLADGGEVVNGPIEESGNYVPSVASVDGGPPPSTGHFIMGAFPCSAADAGRTFVGGSFTSAPSCVCSKTHLTSTTASYINECDGQTTWIAIQCSAAQGDGMFWCYGS